MTIIQSVILGIVEGITEFLPVSSTGHLILFDRLIGIESSTFSTSFNIAIQLGAILAVVVLYWRKFFPVLTNSRELVSNTDTWKKVFAAFITTAIIGFILYKIIKGFLLSNAVLTLWSLFLGGAALIIFELWHRKNKSENSEISYKNAFIIGLVQAISAIPGVSRSGATMVGGLILGIKRVTIVEFSFFLAVPTMAAATAYDLYKSAGSFSFSDFHLLAIGFIVSFVVAALSIKWLLYFVKNHTFISIGIYRIAAALIFWLFIVR